MNRFLFTLLIVPFAAPVGAGVMSRDWLAPGDGLLTFDDVNQREWLDLTQTQLLNFPGDTLEERYQAVIAEVAPGGLFEGFVVGSASDVIALAESAGIVTSSLEFAVNGAATEVLTDFLGDTRAGLPNMTSAGLLVDGSAVALVFGPSGRSDATAGVLVGLPPENDNGVWLYRPVPEPSGFSLASGGILSLFLASGAFHSQCMAKVNPSAKRDQFIL